MAMRTYVDTIISAQVDGPILTAAAAASMLPGQAKRTLDPNYWSVAGQQMEILASGRISCAVTTPGTARFDVRLGAGIVVFDSLAIPLNIVAKTNVHWWLHILMTLRAVGTTANFFGQAMWFSEAALNTAVPTTGPGPGGNTLPFNAAPAVGGNFDSTAANLLDMFFTQTVATGSFTLHQLSARALN